MGRAEDLVRELDMQPHPERGWFAETYRSTHRVPGATGQERAASTAIYFLLSREAPTSYLHRLAHDELFHLYEGGPLEVLLLRDGVARVARLGLDVRAGQRPQLVIPAGTWFGTELAAGASHVLIGCTVAPGFDFADFELSSGSRLLADYPSEAARIQRMSR